MKKGITIAIDGPAASGKGTIAKLLLEKLRAVSFYTGGMYRAVALLCLNNNIEPTDIEKVLKLVEKVVITLRDTTGTGSYASVYLDGANVTTQIYTPVVALAASKVATLKDVREKMVHLQRRMAEKAKNEGRIVIMEGYDIGTKVLPNADFKFFITADVAVRAERRHKQYEKLGIKRTIEEITQEIEERDKRDMNRQASPLSSHPRQNHYVVIDSSHKTEIEVLTAIIHELRKKGINL